jgi:hypothetical protein
MERTEQRGFKRYVMITANPFVSHGPKEKQGRSQSEDLSTSGCKESSVIWA